MKKGVGIHNQDPSAPVALTRWEDGGRAVEEALDRCEALKGFDPNMKVFIKPKIFPLIKMSNHILRISIKPGFFL